MISIKQNAGFNSFVGSKFSTNKKINNPLIKNLKPSSDTVSFSGCFNLSVHDEMHKFYNRGNIYISPNQMKQVESHNPVSSTQVLSLINSKCRHHISTDSLIQLMEAYTPEKFYVLNKMLSEQENLRKGHPNQLFSDTLIEILKYYTPEKKLLFDKMWVMKSGDGNQPRFNSEDYMRIFSSYTPENAALIEDVITAKTEDGTKYKYKPTQLSWLTGWMTPKSIARVKELLANPKNSAKDIYQILGKEWEQAKLSRTTSE